MNIAETQISKMEDSKFQLEIMSMLEKRDVPQEEILEILHLAAGDGALLRRLAIRKKFGEPNAYLRGWAKMLGRKFKIDRRSYIPDAYTEELIERVMAEAPKEGSLLEVGTGCGWISISLKCSRPDLVVSACDIDPNALALARENALTHQAEIDFQESYFVDDVRMQEPDVIIANIPYGGDADYTRRELEERPQMPPISICDPDGPVVTLIDFIDSVRRRNWQSRIYVETGYLSRARLDPMIEGCRHFEHYRNGEFGYLVIDP